MNTVAIYVGCGLVGAGIVRLAEGDFVGGLTAVLIGVCLAVVCKLTSRIWEQVEKDKRG